MPDKPATRQIILEAVVTCIEKYGIDKVTTRKIAEEAGTNIASINYYFRSKDDLLNETLAMTINHMTEDVFAAIDDPRQPFDMALTNVLFYLLDGARKFPGISRAHLYIAVFQNDRQSLSSQAMIKVYERIVKRAVREYPDKEPKHVRLGVSQIMSSIMFALVAGDFFPMPREYQLVSSKNARALAEAYAREFQRAL